MMMMWVLNSKQKNYNKKSLINSECLHQRGDMRCILRQNQIVCSFPANLDNSVNSINRMKKNSCLSWSLSDVLLVAREGTTTGRSSIDAPRPISSHQLFIICACIDSLVRIFQKPPNPPTTSDCPSLHQLWAHKSKYHRFNLIRKNIKKKKVTIEWNCLV